MPNFNRAARLFRRLVGRGANRDVRPELVPDGYYADGFNIRPASTTGNDGGVESIKGEILLFPRGSGIPEGYVLIGSASANGRIVEFWCHLDPANFPIIRIDGQVVAMSENIPYRYDRPLQIAVVERCRSGVLYPADHNAPPLLWDIQAMLDELAAGNTSYFEGYTTEINSVVLSAYPEFPRHVTNTEVGSGSGAPAGQYSYSLRYESPAGDKTNFGPETPLISVALVHDFKWDNTAYPGARTTGGVTDLENPTEYAPTLEWNIDNVQGFSYVEIARRSFNEGEGLNGPGSLAIVARIPMIPGEFRTVTWTDFRDANFYEEIGADIELDRQIDVIAPKAVEYSDNRIKYANFRTAPRDPGFEFRDVGGSAFVPITGKVTTIVDGAELNSGYTDPKNDTYKKSFRRGERYGLAIQGWDSKLGKPYAVPIPGAEDYQFPNRRDRKTGDSLLLSDSPIYAATTDCQGDDPVAPTFDAFTQGTFKKNPDGFVNYIPAYDSGGNLLYGYGPLNPTNPSDPSASDYATSPTNVVSQAPGSYTTIAGAGWNPTYNSMGVAMYGISDVPDDIKAFTIVRTNPARRVICQGLAVYRLEPSGTPSDPPGKNTVEVDFHSRDLSNGYIPQSVLEDMQENPGTYDLQFVCPLGFTTEWYGYAAVRVGLPGVDTGYGIDMLSYAGIQHDELGPLAVNAGEPAAGGMAYPSAGSAPPGNYVGYSAWRQLSRPPGAWNGYAGLNGSNSSYWNEGSNDGNSTFAPESMSLLQEGRGKKMRIRAGQVYSPATFTVSGNTSFNSDQVRAFHQPWYVVNIIRRGASVPQGTGEYVNTGVTIKVRGCIGVSDGNTAQTYRLINERIEDVRGDAGTDFRYVYIEQAGQQPKAWVCMTNNTSFNPADVLDAITADGFWVAPDGTLVYGLYNAIAIDSQNYVEFGNWQGVPIPAPPSGSRIIVRYNPLAPVKVFGGDCTIRPSFHAEFDREYAYTGDEDPYIDTAFQINSLPLPYRAFGKSTQYRLPASSSTIQGIHRLDEVKSVRQWVVAFDTESPTSPAMDRWNNRIDFGGQSMPRGHYAVKPYNFDNGFNGFFPEYFIDYPGWDLTRTFGGLRFNMDSQEYNLDYWKQPNTSSIGLPQTGFTDRIEYCNGIISSLERDPLQENVPGLQTFLASNLKVISEENGEIKALGSLLGGAGRNIYAWTQSGVCRILTNKNILTGASGDQVGLQSISNYWGDEMWLSRTIGLPDQMWRLLVKSYSPTQGSYNDSFFWPDRNSFYKMAGDAVVDIARGKYLSQLTPILSAFPTDYTPQTSSFFDPTHNEAWFSVGQVGTTPKQLIVFSAQTNDWVGKYGYDFDGFTSSGNLIYGHRNMETYKLDEGYVISAGVRESSVTVPVVGNVGLLKELTRWSVTGSRPDEIEVLDENYSVICRQNEAIAFLLNPDESQYWVLKYRSGWEQWAAGVLTSVDPEGKRPQGNYFYLRCTWKSEGDKHLVSLGAFLQDIK